MLCLYIAWNNIFILMLMWNLLFCSKVSHSITYVFRKEKKTIILLLCIKIIAFLLADVSMYLWIFLDSRVCLHPANRLLIKPKLKKAVKVLFRWRDVTMLVWEWTSPPPNISHEIIRGSTDYHLKILHCTSNILTRELAMSRAGYIENWS